MEASVVGGGILLRPMDVVERHEAADRIAARLSATTPLPEDASRSEDEIMEEVIADIDEFRREGRKRNA